MSTCDTYFGIICGPIMPVISVKPKIESEMTNEIAAIRVAGIRFQMDMKSLYKKAQQAIVSMMKL